MPIVNPTKYKTWLVARTTEKGALYDISMFDDPNDADPHAKKLAREILDVPVVTFEAKSVTYIRGIPVETDTLYQDWETIRARRKAAEAAEEAAENASITPPPAVATSSTAV